MKYRHFKVPPYGGEAEFANFARLRDLRSELAERDGVPRLALLGRFKTFTIRDPKPRVSRAPCFRERVLHHAVMAKAGPVLESAFMDAGATP